MRNFVVVSTSIASICGVSWGGGQVGRCCGLGTPLPKNDAALPLRPLYSLDVLAMDHPIPFSHGRYREALSESRRKF